MELTDLFLGPLYAGILYALAYAIRPSVTNKYTRPYFIPALTLKFIGAVALGIIYQFYYGSGDTYTYLYHIKVVGSALSESLSAGLKLFFTADKNDPEIARYTATMVWYGPQSTEYFLVRLGAIIGFLTFYNYTAIALGFAALSFSGLWALYMTLTKIRPHVFKELAWALFYVPSLFFWGSGLLKDTICLGALGWLFYGFYRGAIEKKNISRSLAIAFGAAYLLFRIKVYILLCFLPPALLWLFNENSSRIKNQTVRTLVKPVFFAIGAAVAFYAATNLTKGDERFDVDKIGERSKITADYLYKTSVAQEGSGYYLGKLDGSIGSMVKLAPQAIVVSLYRPFIWEAHNPVMLLSAIESAFFLFFTLQIFWRSGVMRTLRIISSTPVLSLCFVFSLIFAASVGITSSNFGTLVRYKIPLIPFYLGGLYILRSIATQKTRPAVRAKAAQPA